MTRRSLDRSGPRWPRFRALASCGIFVALGLTGCSRGPAHPPTYPVTAKLLVGNEPPAGAIVVLHPQGQTPSETDRPVARVAPDGSLRVTTFDEDDGAPEGEYALTVEWRKLVTRDGESLPGPNVVADEYATPERTPIRITVRPDGPNDQGEIRLPKARR